MYKPAREIQVGDRVLINGDIGRGDSDYVEGTVLDIREDEYGMLWFKFTFGSYRFHKSDTISLGVEEQEFVTYKPKASNYKLNYKVYAFTDKEDYVKNSTLRGMRSKIVARFKDYDEAKEYAQGLAVWCGDWYHVVMRYYTDGRA